VPLFKDKQTALATAPELFDEFFARPSLTAQEEDLINVFYHKHDCQGQTLYYNKSINPRA
jgi:hypothetical protein